MQVSSSDPLWGGLSGLVMDGVRMLAISDAGYWFDGRLVREKGKLVGVELVRITPMLDAQGRPFERKWEIDAEGLTWLGAWFVATERDNRVLMYGGDPFEAPVRGRVVFRAPDGLRRNRGLEAIAARAGDDRVRMVMLSEDSRNADNTIRGFVRLSAQAGGSVSVRKRGNFSVTDAAFLPDGDLLILERRFDLASGPGMRIRRVAGDTVRPNAVLDGEVLIEVGLPHQIDNMEGLAVSPHPEGHRLTLVSDDNRSLLQRTLVLEFLLRE